MTVAYAMEWRPCARFPDYEVSECGDVRRRVAGVHRPVGYRLKGHINCDGYIAYAFRGQNGKKTLATAYRLVAEAFIGPPPSPDHEVAHNNGSRISAHYRDLRWALRAENDADTEVHGTARKGENNGRAKITEDDVRFIRREYRRVKSLRIPGGLVSLERQFHLHRATIINIATGNSWRHVPMESFQ